MLCYRLLYRCNYSKLHLILNFYKEKSWKKIRTRYNKSASRICTLFEKHYFEKNTENGILQNGESLGNPRNIFVICSLPATVTYCISLKTKQKEKLNLERSTCGLLKNQAGSNRLSRNCCVNLDIIFVSEVNITEEVFEIRKIE